jgi:hypothetical protein
MVFEIAADVIAVSIAVVTVSLAVVCVFSVYQVIKDYWDGKNF